MPEVDLTPLDVWSRLRRAALRLSKLRAEAFASADLASWEFDVLAALRRAEPPHQLSPAQLIAATMIGSAAMTNRLDNLQQRGLVDRVPNLGDRRSIFVRIAPEGIERVDAAMTQLARSEAEALDGLGRDDQAALSELLRRLV
nr:MarR family transcriptional regulator [Agromyces seonyuensis]